MAFRGIERRGVRVARPAQITATADHNIPTVNQHPPDRGARSRGGRARRWPRTAPGMVSSISGGAPKQGIVHIIGPELGFTQPGMTIVCGDSHFDPRGAGAVAFGVGTSEVEMVSPASASFRPNPGRCASPLTANCVRAWRPEDVIPYIISQITASGGTGYFIEFAGSTIRSLSMEGRMTVCNMSIECGACGGMIAPRRKDLRVPPRPRTGSAGAEFDEAVARWRELYSDADAVFDKEYRFDAADIAPMITYGTNPGMGMAVDASIPADADPKALEYMGFKADEKLLGKPVDYVFVGSCTNGRIEDLRRFARSWSRDAARPTTSRRGSSPVRRASKPLPRPRGWTRYSPPPVSNSASRAVRRVWR